MAQPIVATGRRKTAVARVRLFDGGDGSILVNEKPFEEFFGRDTLKMIVVRPMLLTDKHKSVRVESLVNGGGSSAQAGALIHGISRALIELDPSLRGILKKEGYLTRDPRMKERKKYGQKGARKRFQFSKR